MTRAYSSSYGITNSRLSYGYDEENRLTSISALDASNQPNSKTEFVYDGLSRLRISRYYAKVNGILMLQNEKRRIYDGMDVVQERDGNNVVTASYTRTGNIGGILARTTNAGSVFYGYDGAGNVTTLTDGSGAEVGSYTYDAWGNTVASSGAMASENPYRFSTKEQIGGLYSYGFRFYSPGLGRWINRDPIAEAGGTNLYGFVGSNPVNLLDDYGLITRKQRDSAMREAEKAGYKVRIGSNGHAVCSKSGEPNVTIPGVHGKDKDVGALNSALRKIRASKSVDQSISIRLGLVPYGPPTLEESISDRLGLVPYGPPTLAERNQRARMHYNALISSTAEVERMRLGQGIFTPGISGMGQYGPVPASQPASPVGQFGGRILVPVGP